MCALSRSILSRGGTLGSARGRKTCLSTEGPMGASSPFNLLSALPGKLITPISQGGNKLSGPKISHSRLTVGLSGTKALVLCAAPSSGRRRQITQRADLGRQHYQSTLLASPLLPRVGDGGRGNHSASLNSSHAEISNLKFNLLSMVCSFCHELHDSGFNEHQVHQCLLNVNLCREGPA